MAGLTELRSTVRAAIRRGARESFSGAWDSQDALRRDGSALRLLLVLVVLFSAFRYAHLLAKLLVEAPFIDFAHYYTYTLMVARGMDPFDTQAVARMDELLGIRRAGAAANYPPLFYLLMRPWVSLPFRPAAVAWCLASQALLLAAVGLWLRRHPSPSPMRVAAALFVVLNYQPLIESLALGQANLVLLLLVSLAWWGLRAGHPWLVAGTVAAAPFVKVQYGLLIPLLWWMGHRRAATRALVLGALGLGLGLALLGPAHHLQYLEYLLDPPAYLYTWTANLSPFGTLHRVLSPAAGGGTLATGVTLALNGLIVVLFARSIRRSGASDSAGVDWAWCLGLTAIPLLSPLTEEHHLVLLLLPLTLLLLAEPKEPAGVTDHVLLVGSILLLASRYSLEQFSAFHQGALSLLASGKLLGTAALAWALMRRLRASSQRA